MLCYLANRKYGGTGLGLWISKNILLKMQGDIRVRSKLGKGSDFILAFPAKASDEVPAVSGSRTEEIPSADVLSGKSYLLLDDIADNTFILGESLKRYGVQSVAKQSGVDALEMFKVNHEAFDCIITDLRMPAMSGQSFIQEVRKFERVANSKKAPVPIVVVTAEASGEEKRLCLSQYGATEFLLKPVKLRELASTLVRIHSSKSHDRKIQHKRVLILDDDVVGSRFLQATLVRGGHKCVQAFSVAEGVRMIRAGPEFDLILLDNLLGDGTGLDFLKMCEGDLTAGTAKRVKVVSVSGNSVEDQRKMYQEVTAEATQGRGVVVDGYLQKPISKQKMLGLVQIL